MEKKPSDPNLVEMGKRLRTLRGERTQDQFAKMLRVNQSTLSRYEDGLSEPSREVLGWIVRELEVSLDWLMYGKGELKRDLDAAAESYHRYPISTEPRKDLDGVFYICQTLRKLWLEQPDKREHIEQAVQLLCSPKWAEIVLWEIAKVPPKDPV